jgi:hypothetical protein
MREREKPTTTTEEEGTSNPGGVNIEMVKNVSEDPKRPRTA